MIYYFFKSLPFLFFISCINKAQCQVIIDSLKSKEDYIINTTSYTKGIYKSFIEFKYNSPSLTLPFTFDKHNVWMVEGDKKSERLKKDDYWGFSDGEKIYIRWNRNYELLEKGRYCYFVAKEINLGVGTIGFVPLIVPLPDTDALIINFNNGKVFEVGKGLLEGILEIDDQELLEQYRQEKQRSKKIREYIVLYNDRNKDKVK